MKIGLALLFLAFSPLAHAQTSPTPSDEYRLIGRGYYDAKDKNQSIAIACTEFNADSLCQTAQFIRWKNKEAELIGNPFKMIYQTDQNGSRLLDTRAMKNEISSALPSLNKRKALAQKNRKVALIAAGIGTLLASGSGLGIVGGAFSFGLYLLTGVKNPKALLLANSFSFQSMSKVFRDQNGWNWSVRPKRLNHKVFQNVLSDLAE